MEVAMWGNKRMREIFFRKDKRKQDNCRQVDRYNMIEENEMRQEKKQK